MDIAVIVLVSFFASLLTFFSGFGLGTILLPVFALWVPLQEAIALTAIVHLVNNLVKLSLTYKHINWSVIKRFGVTAVLAAFVGSALLTYLVDHQDLLKKIIAVVMICFVIFDLVPRLKRMQFDPKYLPLGGILSGFFGGLSGHQGALRSAFLSRCQLPAQAFIASGVVIACFIDLVRLGIYHQNMSYVVSAEGLTLGLWGMAAAAIAAILGQRLLKSFTVDLIQRLVAILLLGFSVGLFFGWL